jgi:replicative DNA helicase
MSGSYTDPVQEVVGRLRGAKPAGPGKYSAFCPAHQDEKSRSLSIGTGSDGRVLLHCHAGCSVQAVVNALGLTMADLSAHRGNGGHHGNGAGNRPPPNEGAGRWERRAQSYQTNLTPEERIELANTLGVPEATLATLGVGSSRDKHGDHWTFPEWDGAGNVIGITRRYRNGDKLAKAGGERGLFIPTGWQDRYGPLFCPEGASDTLALTAVGLAAVGRPSNTGGADYLAALLKSQPEDGGRPVVILGEFDPKWDGSWPGKTGATKVAADLAAALPGARFPVSWGLPPGGHKDAREWVKAQKLDPHRTEVWTAAGERFLEAMGGRLNSTGPQAEQAAVAFRFDPLDSTLFAAFDYHPRWLVRNILVRGQPVILGGPRKTLKTTVMEDLAISLATGTPFLGTFRVHEPVRVAVLSGESGEHTLQESATRICNAKGIDLAWIGGRLLWQFDLPQLASGADMAALQKGLKDAGVEVLIVDPLYLCMLGGQEPGKPPLRPENLFDVGPLLLAVTRSCLGAGVTPILIHHTKKGTSGAREQELDLDDLAYAGLAEFCRQWMLISRRERFEPGSGLHKIWLNVGGSAGQCGLWSVDLDEGVLNEHFGGRKWDVTVASATAARQTAGEQREQKKEEKRREQLKADGTLVLNMLDQLDRDGTGVSWTHLRDMSPLTASRASKAIQGLLVEGVLERVPDFMCVIANGAKRPCKGVRRRRRQEAAGTSEHRTKSQSEGSSDVC